MKITAFHIETKAKVFALLVSLVFIGLSCLKGYELCTQTFFDIKNSLWLLFFALVAQGFFRFFWGMKELDFSQSHLIISNAFMRKLYDYKDIVAYRQEASAVRLETSDGLTHSLRSDFFLEEEALLDALEERFAVVKKTAAIPQFDWEHFLVAPALLILGVFMCLISTGLLERDYLGLEKDLVEVPIQLQEAPQWYQAPRNSASGNHLQLKARGYAGFTFWIEDAPLSVALEVDIASFRKGDQLKVAVHREDALYKLQRVANPPAQLKHLDWEKITVYKLEKGGVDYMNYSGLKESSWSWGNLIFLAFGLLLSGVAVLRIRR